MTAHPDHLGVCLRTFSYTRLEATVALWAEMAYNTDGSTKDDTAAEKLQDTTRDTKSITRFLANGLRTHGGHWDAFVDAASEHDAFPVPDKGTFKRHAGAIVVAHALCVKYNCLTAYGTNYTPPGYLSRLALAICDSADTTQDMADALHHVITPTGNENATHSNDTPTETRPREAMRQINPAENANPEEDSDSDQETQ